MDFSQALIEIKNENKVYRTSKGSGSWLELSFGNIIVASRRGPFVDWVPKQKDILATDWELKTDEKLTKVEYTRKVIFEAECPKCLVLNSISKEDADSKDEKIIKCVKCEYEFGLKKSGDSGVVV